MSDPASDPRPGPPSDPRPEPHPDAQVPPRPEVEPHSQETKEDTAAAGATGAALMGCATVGLMPWIVIAAAIVFLVVLGFVLGGR